jgi:hypothetical protein
MARNIIKNPAGVSVTASLTDLHVSRPFGLKSDREVFLKIVLSAASQTNGITFKLKDSYNDGETYFDVGSESSISLTKKTFTGGTAEISTITFPAFAGATQGDYVTFETEAGVKYAFWLDLDAAGTAPTGALYVAATNKIEVDIVTGDTAAQVAAKAVAAIGTIALVTILDNEDGTVTFTQTNGGACTDPAPKNADDSGAGSITVSVGTAGSDGGINLSTNAITSTSHGFVTGDPVIFTAGTAAPSPLVSGTTYYVILVDANTLKLATTQALALAGTAVDLTIAGRGTQALYAAHYEMRLIASDSSDIAQMPIWDDVIVVANSGASDTCTVSAIYIPE